MNKILFILTAVVISVSFWLIIIYNGTVNLEHNIAKLISESQNIQNANIELKEKILSALSGENLEKIAEEQGLVKDRNPQYFEIDQKWVIASRF